MELHTTFKISYLHMKPFNVYSLFDIEPVKSQGCYLWDKNGNMYLDFYGGHAVISVGHHHPHYVEKLKKQLDQIAFYSNAVINGLQIQLAEKLGKLSGYGDYSLFLCNSGAEANENALKLASFHNNKKKILAFQKAFHGRTSAAVSVTDNPKIIAPINQTDEVSFLPMNDLQALEFALKDKDISSVIIEGIQGIGGIILPSDEFLRGASKLCKEYGALLILDEVQSGYGRSGKFFAHQWAGIRPDIITVAKGMGNGFPIGGVLISPEIEAKKGMLGSTFGGNYLACAAGIAVLDIMEEEDLIDNALQMGRYMMERLPGINQIKAVRGKGLMIGLEFDFPVKAIREHLLYTHKIFTGVSGSNMIRLLPPLCITTLEADILLNALKATLSCIDAKGNLIK